MPTSIVLEVEQSTPALIGYANPLSIDPHYYLRPSSLKGIWRWTARALVGGVLYDQSRLCGAPGGQIVRLPLFNEVDTVSQIVGKELGLGFAGKDGAEASSFRIRVEITKRPQVGVASHGALPVASLQRTQLQRIQLLTLGRRRVYFFVNGGFRVIIEPRRNISQDVLEAGLRTLMLALSIMGVGKGSRRGLGSFDIIDVKGEQIEVSKGNLGSFIEETYNLIHNIIQRSSISFRLKPCRKGLPPYPVLSKHTVHGTASSINVARVIKVSNIPWTVIHNFFVRAWRCRRLTGAPKCADPLRRNFAAWVLGLPRQQRGTGYQVLDNVSRRASPILVSVHGDNHMFGNGVFVSILVSADWPTTIRWRGAGSRIISVNERLIVDAINIATNEFYSYVGKGNIVHVWP